MYSDEESCSDCKLIVVEEIWTTLLLNWLNICVNPARNVTKLNTRSLVDIIDRYKHDICKDDLTRAILCTDDLEPFITYKYPILRLRNLSEDGDETKKLYVMTSILLYHCCVNSQTGAVDGDICKKLNKQEQEMVLRFCESLSEMEVTIPNMQTAIKKCVEATVDLKVNIAEYRKVFDSSQSTESLMKESTSAQESDITTSPYLESPKFGSSVTILPSVVAETAGYEIEGQDYSNYTDRNQMVFNAEQLSPKETKIREDSNNMEEKHSSECSCAKCMLSERWCDSDQLIECSTSSVINAESAYTRNISEQYSMKILDSEEKSINKVLAPHKVKHESRTPKHSDTSLVENYMFSIDNIRNKDSKSSSRVKKYFLEGGWKYHWSRYLFLVALIMLSVLGIVLITISFIRSKSDFNTAVKTSAFDDGFNILAPILAWQCKKGFCQRVPIDFDEITYSSLSRCTLLCMGPQIWPFPIGYTYYSKKIVAFATNKLEYKFETVPSEPVRQYLAEAFKYFLEDLGKLEKVHFKEKRNETQDLTVRKVFIQMDVESDPDPRLRLNTEESYSLKIDTHGNQINIQLESGSFCGIRHGLETLSQLILLDQNSGHLITLSSVVIKDSPSYKYRGLMLDTARNFIPIEDIIRTIDAMAINKLNTFHWRISDVTSFPLVLPPLRQLFEYGAYDRSMVYTKENVKAVVKRASFRGIRVLIEVAVPGPVGRAWSWTSDATCPSKEDNCTLDNLLCTRLKMQDSVFDMLQIIYKEILELTQVDDVFHLSDGLFSLINCYYLLDDREGFLDKALERLKLANKGFLPKMPIIWYTSHLERDFEAKSWEKYGVQLYDWYSNPATDFLTNFKVIHSSKWDLSCEMTKHRCRKYRTWQEMYTWKSWRNLNVFTIEGGETLLWTDLVDSGNLDSHLWPRAAAVAERLWSDLVINSTVTDTVYVRLDSHRWRMLLRGVKVQPIWPVWCSFNYATCVNT